MHDTGKNTSRVIALIATIPERRALCERLLGELQRQSRRPDGMILVLDGFKEHEELEISVPVDWELAVFSSDLQQGPGGRWLRVLDLMSGRCGNFHDDMDLLQLDDIIVCIDDDAVLVDAPEFIAGLAMAVERDGGAAAAMGRDARGRTCLPGPNRCGLLIHAAGLGLTVRAKHLEGLGAFADEVKAAGGPDALGPLGDDDALVSAFLWKKGILIHHAATGNIFEAPAGKKTSFSKRRVSTGETADAQKEAIARVTGWPFVARARL